MLPYNFTILVTVAFIFSEGKNTLHSDMKENVATTFSVMDLIFVRSGNPAGLAGKLNFNRLITVYHFLSV